MLVLYLTFMVCCPFVCVSAVSWPVGELDYLGVDETRMEGSQGAEVVEATLDALDSVCMLPSDRLLLRRFAQTVSNERLTAFDGVEGIWPVTDAMLTATKRLASYTDLAETILSQYDLDWQLVTSSDLQKPFFSALTFRLYLQTLPSCTVPRTYDRQGAFLADEIPATYSVTQTEFMTSFWKGGDSNDCVSGNADIVLILDASIEPTVLVAFAKSFLSVFTLGFRRTRLALIQFSSTATVEVYLNRYFDSESMEEAIDEIEFSQDLGNQTGDVTAALTEAASVFSVENGARRLDTGSSRIAVLLTQGETNDTEKVAAAAVNLTQKNVAVFAIGIGGGVTQEYLSLIGQGCNRAALVTDLSELLEFIPEVQKLICKEPTNVERDVAVSGLLYAGERTYAAYTVHVDKGMKIDLSTWTGEIKVYFSTKTKNPSPALHQWKCRGAMNERGTCMIPPEQLQRLNKTLSTTTATGTTRTITIYAAFTTDAMEGTKYHALVAGVGLTRGSGVFVTFVIFVSFFINHS